MSRLIRLGRVSELSKFKMKSFRVNNENILLISLDGEFYAFEDKCPHMGYPLSMGSLNGEILKCGFHYAKFNVIDGKPLSPSANKPLKKYRVILKENEVFIELRE